MPAASPSPTPATLAGQDWTPNNALVRCGDCAFFVRDGKCGFLDTPEGKDRGRTFAFAPFWVWSDCYSDREQVRAGVETLCSTFKPQVQS